MLDILGAARQRGCPRRPAFVAEQVEGRFDAGRTAGEDLPIRFQDARFRGHSDLPTAEIPCTNLVQSIEVRQQQRRGGGDENANVEGRYQTRRGRINPPTPRAQRRWRIPEGS